MNKLFLSLLAVFTLCISLQGQVIISPTFQTGEFFFIDQLYQVNVLNSETTPVEGYIEVSIEGNDHQEIIKGTSFPFVLSGASNYASNQINWNSFPEYGSNQLAISLRTTGSLPQGEYILCYRFLDASTNQLLGVNCQEKLIQGYGPPELVSPFNEEVVSTSPILTWRPPLTASFVNVSYDLRLVELNKGQSYLRAIKQNFPIIDVRNISETMVPFATSNVELKEGQKYIWQVVARTGKYNLGQTEIWEFTYSSEETQQRLSNTSGCYAKIQTLLDGGYTLSENTLRFTYDNFRNDSSLDIIIYEKNSPLISYSNTATIAYGLNKIEIDLSTYSLANNKHYVLEIIFGENQKQYLEFYYDTNSSPN